MSAPVGGADPVAPVGGGMFDVNIAEAPTAIRELEAARRELEGIRTDAQRLGQVDPPARDDVSLDAAKLLAARAVEGSDSFIAALDQGIDEVTRLIQALRAGFDQYRARDEEAGTRYQQLP